MQVIIIALMLRSGDLLLIVIVRAHLMLIITILNVWNHDQPDLMLVIGRRSFQCLGFSFRPIVITMEDHIQCCDGISSMESFTGTKGINFSPLESIITWNFNGLGWAFNVLGQLISRLISAACIYFSYGIQLAHGARLDTYL